MTAPVTCLIPAYQAAATITDVVDGLRRVLPSATVLVVDDGSTDGTREVARRCCDHVLAFAANRGKGAALRAGVAHALAAGAQSVLSLDADGQHDPAYAPALLAALDRADVVVGVRARRGSAMPRARRLSNALAARAMSAAAGLPLADAQSGFRAIRRSVLEAVRPAGDRYDYEAEFLLQAARCGFRVAGVPVPTIYGAASHFTLRDGLLVIRSIWRHRAGTPKAAV